jgi:hypothetical protein
MLVVESYVMFTTELRVMGIGKRSATSDDERGAAQRESSWSQIVYSLTQLRHLFSRRSAFPHMYTLPADEYNRNDSNLVHWFRYMT